MLSFVGVGPGDPELITLKALRLIREADVVALADTGLGDSAVARILGDALNGKALLRLSMPMKGDRESWADAHIAAARQLAARLDAGESIAYPVLGDPLLYATSGYLLALLKDRYPVQVVPGVAAVLAGASAARLPLAEADEPLTILPGLKPGQALPEGNVAVMKASRCLNEIARQLAGRQHVMLRNLGMPDEYIGPIQDAPEGRSYFTTVIVKAR